MNSPRARFSPRVAQRKIEFILQKCVQVHELPAKIAEYYPKFVEIKLKVFNLQA